MDTHYTLQDTQFIWDDEKAKANFSKHSLSFETACEAFFDPFFHIIDDEVVDGEERESLIGMTIGWQLLFVVYTIRNETIRIISARLATRHERRVYEEQ
jgi:uncharacterized DUF497 family protein